MKTSPKILLLAALLAALFPIAAPGQAMNLAKPETVVASVDRLLTLTPAQKAQVERIVQRAAADLLALPERERLMDKGEIRPRMRNEIRAVLTPAQLHLYNRTSQMNGGGLTLQTPENKVARLDALVQLTPEQKTRALGIFTEELDALLDLPEARRGPDGVAVRQTARTMTRELLTAAQQALYDAAPQSQGGGRTGG